MGSTHRSHLHAEGLEWSLERNRGRLCAAPWGLVVCQRRMWGYSSWRWVPNLGPPLCSCRGFLLDARAVEGREGAPPFSDAILLGGGLPRLRGLRRVDSEVDELPSQPVTRINEKVRHSLRQIDATHNTALNKA